VFSSIRDGLVRTLRNVGIEQTPEVLRCPRPAVGSPAFPGTLWLCPEPELSLGLPAVFFLTWQPIHLHSYSLHTCRTVLLQLTCILQLTCMERDVYVNGRSINAQSVPEYVAVILISNIPLPDLAELQRWSKHRRRNEVARLVAALDLLSEKSSVTWS